VQRPIHRFFGHGAMCWKATVQALATHSRDALKATLGLPNRALT